MTPTVANMLESIIATDNMLLLKSVIYVPEVMRVNS
ncbi:hypothetical protein SAMN05421840_106161 [Shewanella morhuae]|nr:hypothetical protein SAMN05421840_106161 [Shewanella morhuae]